MIHSGAVIAAGISQGRTQTGGIDFKVRLCYQNYSLFVGSQGCWSLTDFEYLFLAPTGAESSMNCFVTEGGWG